ncbi:MAG: hypothetical protein JWO67_1756 [Streptosporangiaceae bacterium]|nr:hypothetical protein [Streptosporangiaceae bacterium]
MLLVPLGDLARPHRLITVLLCLTAGCLAVAAAAPGRPVSVRPRDPRRRTGDCWGLPRLLRDRPLLRLACQLQFCWFSVFIAA